MIITIDGKVATGKSTIAKLLAKEIAFIFFDTGAMYRAFTYAALKENILAEDHEAIITFLKNFHFRIKVEFGERRYFVDHEDVTEKIRSEEVTRNVSEYARIKEVREKLVAIQREFAKGVNAVFEGRDMGSKVFPDAELKIFLTGDPLVRAKRRYEEIMDIFPEQAEKLTMEECLENINKRDEIDSTREISPLKKADDAYEIDTSFLTPSEVIYRILEIKERL